MNGGRRITYEEISKKSGISIATISRVMNKSNQVTEATRSKVLSALKSEGYDTDEYDIAKDEERLILFNVPSLKNIFYSPIISAARMQAERKGYTLLINEFDIKSDNIERFIRLVKKTNALALIMTNSMTRELLERINSEIITVMCCEAVLDGPSAYVTIDDEGAAYTAVRYLISLGRRKIAFINGPASFKYARERLKGYEDALREAGHDIDRRYVAEIGEDMDYESAKAAAIHLLSYTEYPDAFFTSSDVIACAVEKAALEKGLKVPEDIAVVGFDDIMASHMANPSITTVRQPTVQMGSLSADMAIKLIEKDDKFLKSVLLGTELIIRQSTTI